MSKELVICALIVVMLTTSCSHATEPTASIVKFPPTPLVSDIASSNFISQIASDVELNSGITIERLLLLSPSNGPTPSPNYISISVFNHSDEQVRFQDLGFGIRVFTLLPDDSSWLELKLPYRPAKGEKLLPPSLDKIDPEILNTWDIPNWDLDGFAYVEIRIYVEGIGLTTHKKYGAFLDIGLQR
jgi:hypothetical protein